MGSDEGRKRITEVEAMVIVVRESSASKNAVLYKYKEERVCLQ